MKNKALAITLGICEIKRLLKSPIFYVIIAILIFATLDAALELFQSPYDTREKYEERLGYVSYQDLRGYDEIAFLEKIGSPKKPDTLITVFEHTLNLDERARLNDARQYHSEQYDNLFNEYVKQGKIDNIRELTFKQIQELPEIQYNKYKNSIFVPGACRNMSYFYRATSNNYKTNYPTYEEAVKLWEQENMSAHISREYYFRLEFNFTFITAVLIILSLTSDYKYGTNKMIYTTKFKSAYYILMKTFSLGIFMIFVYFLVSILPAYLFVLTVNAVNWIYTIRDFIYTFLVFIVPTQLFICALSLCFSLLLKDWLFSTLLSFYTIFLSGTKMAKLPDGLTMWIIYPYKYFPRIPFALGAMQKYSEQIFYHNLLYYFIAIALIIIDIWIWDKQRKGLR